MLQLVLESSTTPARAEHVTPLQVFNGFSKFLVTATIFGVALVFVVFCAVFLEV